MRVAANGSSDNVCLDDCLQKTRSLPVDGLATRLGRYSNNFGYQIAHQNRTPTHMVELKLVLLKYTRSLSPYFPLLWYFSNKNNSIGVAIIACGMHHWEAVRQVP